MPDEEIFRLTGDTSNAREALLGLVGVLNTSVEAVDRLATAVNGMGSLGALDNIGAKFASMAMELETDSVMIDGVKTSLASLAATEGEAAARASEEAAAERALADARAQLVGTLMAEVDAEKIGIQAMQEMAAEEKNAARAALELSAANQTVSEKALGALPGVTQLGEATKSLKETGAGLTPILDENGRATGAFAYQAGAASPRVEELKKQGQALMAGMKDTSTETDKATLTFSKMVTNIADAVNEYMALIMVLQMGGQAIASFVALGAGIIDSFNVIQGMTASTDAQMQQWASDVGALDTKYGQLMTDAVPALDLITRAGFQAGDATTVLDNAMLLTDSTGTKLSETTKAMTLAMNIYGLGASQARDVSLQLFNALSTSTLPLSSFVSLIDQSGLTAKNLGISLGDLITQIGFAGKMMGGSSLTIREFQGILDGLTTFTELSAAAMTKLAAGFDLAAFSAQNDVSKFLDLAKAADGNLKSFTGMIGGSQNAQTALDNLGISTHQLAVNAANLGLAFDPVRYNALDAAGKLFYLATIADFSSTKFTALTKGGLEPATAAFLGLMGSMDAAGKHLADLNPHFDLAKFKLLDFAQQLHYVADFVGGTTTDAFAKFVGGLKNVPLAVAIMNTEMDKTPGHMKTASDAVAHHGGAYKAMEQLVADSSTKYEADLQKQQDAADRVAKDVEHQTAGMSSAWQHMSTSFVTLFGPAIAGTMQWVAGQMDFLATHSAETVLGLMTPWQGIPNFFSHLFGDMFANLDPMWTGFKDFLTQISALAVLQIEQKFSAGWKTITDGVMGFVHAVSDWFVWLMHNLVGGSIVPDMVAKITTSFTTGATNWLAAIVKGVTDIVGAFVKLPADVMFWVNMMVTQMLGALNTAASSLFTSGVHIVQSLADGIMANIGAAVAAAWNVATAVANALAHHSPPKEGPMKDDDTWAPNFMAQFTAGITDNIGKLRTASLLAAQSVGSGMNMSSPMGSIGSSSLSSALAPTNALLRQLVSQASIGSPAMGPLGTVNQQFGNVNFNGVGMNNLNQMYQQFNRMAGLAHEASQRGSVSGMGW